MSVTDLTRKIWTCSVCGRQDNWGLTWEWYGSLKDLDDEGEKGIKVVCSKKCRKELTHAADE